MLISRDRHLVAFALSVGLASFAAAPQAEGQQQQRAVASGHPFDSSGVGDTSIFAPLHLRGPNIFRAGSGAPGSHYWEQRADYDLKATLDTGAKQVTGQETLRYTNNSPDTLSFIWMQVEQDAFKSGSLNSYVFPPDSRFGALNFEGGDVIDHFNQLTGPGTKPVSKPLHTRVDGTQMQVDLAAPLAPGQTATFGCRLALSRPRARGRPHGARRRAL